MVVSKEGEMWQGTVSQFPAKTVNLPGAQRPTLLSSQNRFVPTKKNAMGGPSVNMKVDFNNCFINFYGNGFMKGY